MKISSKFDVSVPIFDIWEVIFNPHTIGRTIPGCVSVEVIDDYTYLSTVAFKISDLKARYRLISKIEELNSPFRIVTFTTWKGIGIPNNVNQTTTVQLQQKNSGATEVAIDSELNIKGTLANLSAIIMKAKIESIVEDWGQRMKSVFEEHCKPIEKACFHLSL